MPYVRDRWAFEFRNESLEELKYREVIDAVVDGQENIEDFADGSEELEGLLEDTFRVLGGMQRDGLYYSNLLENVMSGGQAAADQIRPLMSEFQMLSADLEPPDGPPHSPLRKAVDYFLRALSALARRMLKIVVDIVIPGIEKMFKGLKGGLVTVGLSAGFPPALVFNFDPSKFDMQVTDFIRYLIDTLFKEMEQAAI